MWSVEVGGSSGGQSGCPSHRCTVVVPHIIAQWLSLTSLHSGPSLLCTVVVPHFVAQWLSLTLLHSGCPSLRCTVVVPHIVAQWLSLTSLHSGCPSLLCTVVVPHFARSWWQPQWFGSPAVTTGRIRTCLESDSSFPPSQTC